jgi:hypothetical protein
VTRALIAFTALLAASSAEAQTDLAASRAAIISEWVSAGDLAAQSQNPSPFQTTLGVGRQEHVAAFLIAINSPERETYKVLLAALEARVDKQVGATPASNGSTSLAMKGLVPDILGVAVENGALNKEVRGTTLTFRANPMGLIKALQGQGLLDTYADYSTSAGARYASRFSASASFDTSLGPSGGTFTADAQQLTMWAARYIIFNGRDAAASQYADLWRQLANSSSPYLKAVASLNAVLGGDCFTSAGAKNPKSIWPDFCAWQDKLTTDVAEVDSQWRADRRTPDAAAKFKNILENALPELEKLKMPPEIGKSLDGYVVQLTGVAAQIDDIYAFVGKGPLLTFDWSTARDATLPDLYTATGIFEMALGATRKTDLTINAVASFYQSQPTNVAQSFKSFELTAQLEHPLGATFVLPSATGSLSARYSYLPNDTAASGPAPGAGTAPASVGIAPKGNIVVIQGKLTVQIKGTGMKVPLSVTASNRTELIKEKDVRASVGVTFDLDALTTALTAKAK